MSTDDRIAAMLARSGRGADDPPYEVRMLATLTELHQWASDRDVDVHLISTDVDGRHIYAAHSSTPSRVARGPNRQRQWRTAGFPT